MRSTPTADRLYIDDYLGDTKGLFDFTKDLLDRLIAETHRRLGQLGCLVLKNPELLLHFPQAAALLPDARFVVSVRDPKDTIASMLRVGEKHRHSGVNSFLATAIRYIDNLCQSYRRFYLPVMSALKKDQGTLKEKVVFVRYESLVGDTRNVINGLATFCKVPLAFESVIEERTLSDQIDQGNDALHSHPRWSAYLTELSGGPIFSTSISNYRKRLTEAEAGRIDRQCADIRKAFGHK
ncbi:sulfotransferase [Pelagibius litoralis]|uniref:Sulfotransferase n=1 Tax=Pelagibius litoralis TaxID=374515 RepID=A0A967C4Y5_9PROT|nr:sulfotransferase [Pelagibius litoralis]NIA68784.1 sulfotransferase [Pelagibius litoralis]